MKTCNSVLWLMDSKILKIQLKQKNKNNKRVVLFSFKLKNVFQYRNTVSNFSVLEKTGVTCHTIFFPQCDPEVLVRTDDNTYFALLLLQEASKQIALQVIIIIVPYEGEGESLYCYAH